MPLGLGTKRAWPVGLSSFWSLPNDTVEILLKICQFVVDSLYGFHSAILPRNQNHGDNRIFSGPVQDGRGQRADCDTSANRRGVGQAPARLALRPARGRWKPRQFGPSRYMP